TNPSARLATVIPSWQAATLRLRWSRVPIASISDFAPDRPRLTSSSTRVLRTATRANSAATKNPFTAIRAGTDSSPITLRVGVGPGSAANNTVRRLRGHGPPRRAGAVGRPELYGFGGRRPNFRRPADPAVSTRAGRSGIFHS